MKLKLPVIYGQRDARWSNILLGYNSNNPYNIGNYGCLITCLGMLTNNQPDNVNQVLKDNGGFQANGGLFVWPKASVLSLTIDYVSPYYDGPVTSQGIAKAKSLLDSGEILLCEVDFNPATTGEEMHFVLATGYDGDKFTCADPWTGTEHDLDTYGGFSRGVLQFRTYTKTFPQDNSDNSDTIAVLKTDFENLVGKLDKQEKLLNEVDDLFNQILS